MAELRRKRQKEEEQSGKPKVTGKFNLITGEPGLLTGHLTVTEKLHSNEMTLIQVNLTILGEPYSLM